MSDLVLSHQDGRSVILTLNQPARRNPISPEMRAALIGHLETLRRNDAVRCVILTGSGDVFCSGLDLSTLNLPFQSGASIEAVDPAAVLEAHVSDSKSIRDFFDYLLGYPKPLIAAVNGPAVAGGAGVALLCDASIFSEKASICFSEVRLGFVPAIVGVYLQLSIGIKRARELMISARTVSAHESLNIGVATTVVSSDRLMDECRAWAAKFEKNGPQAMAATKHLMAAQLRHKVSNDMDLAIHLNASVRQSSECVEGVGAFLRKEKPAWA